MSLRIRRPVRHRSLISVIVVAVLLVIVAIPTLRRSFTVPPGSQSADGQALQTRLPLPVPAQEAYLKAFYPGEKDTFGESVAVDGDTVVIGVPREDSSTGINTIPDDATLNAGAAYVFVRSGTTWTEQAYLKAANPGAKDFFGSSVAISGDTIVIGAYAEDSSTTGGNTTPNEAAKGAGAAYVFVRSGTTWTQQAYLKASNAGADDYFGSSVAVDGEIIVIGAHHEASSTPGVNSTPNENTPEAGAAYVFMRSGSTWTEQAYLKASNPGVTTDSFGRSVAVDGDTVVVGAPGENSSTPGINSPPNEAAGWAGAAYVFVRSGTTWMEQAYLKASNPGAKDFFGSSVAISSDTIVVGARYESSSTQGVNTTPDDAAAEAGAAYVFMRSGNTWTEQAYLKASNTGSGDGFGASVAVSGHTVVVGAMGRPNPPLRWDDWIPPDINSPPEDPRGAGAAYGFVRSGTTWSQQALLKAANPGEMDYFGFSVAVSGDTVVVGALHEDSSTSDVNATPTESAPDAGAAYIFGGIGSP